MASDTKPGGQCASTPPRIDAGISMAPPPEGYTVAKVIDSSMGIATPGAFSRFAEEALQRAKTPQQAREVHAAARAQLEWLKVRALRGELPRDLVVELRLEAKEASYAADLATGRLLLEETPRGQGQRTDIRARATSSQLATKLPRDERKRLRDLALLDDGTREAIEAELREGRGITVSGVLRLAKASSPRARRPDSVTIAAKAGATSVRASAGQRFDGSGLDALVVALEGAGALLAGAMDLVREDGGPGVDALDQAQEGIEDALRFWRPAKGSRCP